MTIRITAIYTTLLTGLKNGISILWMLTKIIFPVTIIIKILGYTPLLTWLVELFAPVMSFFGLPGDAAFILVIGNLLSCYAGIAAIYTLELQVKQVFILAVMLSFSHDLIIESAIARKMGINVLLAAIFRLGIAFIFAYLLHVFWPGGQDIAQYGLFSGGDAGTVQESGFLAVLLDAAKAAAGLIVQIGMVLIPILIFIQVLKDLNAVPYLAVILRPFTRFLGVSDKAGLALIAGIFFGITYGAGVIIQTAREENLTKKDLYLIAVFLVACHSVVEDTLIFLPFGINVLILLIFRFVAACLLTVAASWVWRMVELKLKTE